MYWITCQDIFTQEHLLVEDVAAAVKRLQDAFDVSQLCSTQVTPHAYAISCMSMQPSMQLAAFSKRTIVGAVSQQTRSNVQWRRGIELGLSHCLLVQMPDDLHRDTDHERTGGAVCYNLMSKNVGKPAQEGAVKPAMQCPTAGIFSLTPSPPMMIDQSRASFSMRRCAAL